MGAVCCLEKKTRKTKRSKEKENEKLVENYLGLPPIIHIMREKAEIQKKMKAERLGSKTPRGRRLEVREEPRCRSGSFNPLTQEETEDFTFRKTSTLAPKKFQRDSVIHLFKRNFDIKDQAQGYNQDIYKRNSVVKNEIEEDNFLSDDSFNLNQ